MKAIRAATDKGMTALKNELLNAKPMPRWSRHHKRGAADKAQSLMTRNI